MQKFITLGSMNNRASFLENTLKRVVKKKMIKVTLLSSILLSCSAMAADKVTFQLDWLPSSEFAPVYVGVQEGFFKEVDLEVKIASGRGSTDAITKIATGQADIGNSDIGALMAAKAQNKIPVVAVLPYFSQSPHAFFTLKGNGIKSLEDLKGKKIATSPFTSSNAFLPLVLKENDLEEKDIKLIKADPGTLSPLMIRGKVDAIIAWTTNKAVYEEQAKVAKKELIVMPWSQSGLSLYNLSVLASERFLKERPDVAKRFLKAYIKSVKFTHEFPNKAASDLSKMVPEIDTKIVAAQIKNNTSLVYNKISNKDNFTNFTAKRITETWEYVAKANGLPSEKFNPQSIVNNTLLSK